MVNILVVCPILLALYLCFLIISCYIQGLLRHHFAPFWPVVSDSGNYIPEANVFSWTIVVIGSLFLAVASTRYLQIKAITSDAKFARIISHHYGTEADLAFYRSRFNCLNWSTFICGLVIGYSSMATGCFRFADSFIYHNLVAAGVFLVTPVYMAIHVYLSGVCVDFVNTRTVFLTRLAITASAIMVDLLFILTENLQFTLYKSYAINPVKRLFWSPNEAGFVLHILNSTSEWAYLLLLGPYVFTFAEDFSRLNVGVHCTYVFLDDEVENGDGNAQTGGGPPQEVVVVQSAQPLDGAKL